MTNHSITARGITIDGILYSAEYSKSPSGTVYAFVRLDDDTLRIKFDTTDARYTEALTAWEVSYRGKDAAETAVYTPIIVQGTVCAEYTGTSLWAECPENDEPEPQAEPVPQAEAPEAKPETTDKIWIGTSIKGKGWEIYFDGAYGRTRVLFKRKPHEAARKAVKDAGFFWSPAMKSWNKKLTCKAFRTAQALALELGQLCC